MEVHYKHQKSTINVQVDIDLDKFWQWTEYSFQKYEP